MSAILYPVAANADEALAKPKGRAARTREAADLAGGPVVFVTEPVTTVFASREAALDALAGRLDDDRPGSQTQAPPEDRYLALAERIEGPAVPAPAEPAFADGRRWPAPAQPPRTIFRVMVSYWRTGADHPPASAAGQPRALRRKTGAAGLTAAELRALAQAPLRPVKPQQPLDVGLFEARVPESPDLIIPDE